VDGPFHASRTDALSFDFNGAPPAKQIVPANEVLIMVRLPIAFAIKTETQKILSSEKCGSLIVTAVRSVACVGAPSISRWIQ
jgi:hypothetical protein